MIILKNKPHLKFCFLLLIFEDKCTITIMAVTGSSSRDLYKKWEN